MKFGSWTYDGFQLDLQLQDEMGGDLSSFVTNGEWELLGKIFHRIKLKSHIFERIRIIYNILLK